MNRIVQAAFALMILCPFGAAAQAPAPAPSPSPAPKDKPAEKKPADQKPAEQKPPVKPGQPKPYKEVITAEAKSDKGLFTVHRIDEKVFFEIPPALYGRDMLWQTEIAQTGAGAGFGGSPVGSRVVEWTRRNNTIYLRAASYSIRGDGKTAIQRAVDASNVGPIVAAFPVEAEGDNKAPVIDVTRLYAGDGAPVPAGPALGGGPDPSRSFLDHIKSFPTNIEARVVLTVNRAGGGIGNPFLMRAIGGAGPVTATAHHSMVLLPEKPMMGRYFDARVGYFSEEFADYGTKENRVKDREFIARYRLEKKDPNAAVSDPVHPIVYYVSREVPEQWRKYIRQAIEDWQPAFEQAGFSHAIIAKDAPTEAEDSEWDPEDARYSVIRWIAQPVMNAMGPHVHDPRSGEIISAHVIVWHDALKLAEQWYFTQCADLDARARKLPLPEPLMGELIRYIVCHEVGHTLGLRHNHKASSSYTVAQLRSKAFTEKYGDEASIMDYGRFNYVAQPGDNARLIPMLGPYDRFAVEWGYKPMRAASPDDEKSELDAIAARQIADPMLRFGGEDGNARFDPTVQMEDLGSDPIAASTLGLKNIDRVAAILPAATEKFGEDYDLLEEMYTALLGQRTMELMHVTKLVGGVVEVRTHAGRGGDVYRPVPAQQQRRAVAFLLANAFQPPRSFLNPSILNRIEGSGAADRVLSTQAALLNGLLNESRVRRMLDREVLGGGPTYTVANLVSDLQNGIWSELDAAAPQVGLYRRNLQRAYLEALRPRLVGNTGSQNELRAIATESLRALKQRIAAKLPATKDRATELHLRDCRSRIDDILNPKTVAQSAQPSGGFIPLFLRWEEMLPEAQPPGDACMLFSARDWLNSVTGMPH